jgi:N6-L-threonylcarbamoyladenine synthase
VKILGIETSCDETSASVVESGKSVLSMVTATSMAKHIETGGIIPENAARAQQEYVIATINKALVDAFGEASPSRLLSQIDAIAVDIGHGLIGPLLVGVETAKTLSLLSGKPLVPISHVEGHIFASLLTSSPSLPALCLVVSGGHSDFYSLDENLNIKWIAGTRDDAAGECFDKCARLLGLPYPGGPQISMLSEKYIEANPGEKLNFFPRPLAGEDTYDLSFSGLKTAVLRETKEGKGKSIEFMCAQIQESIVDSLIIKSKKIFEGEGFNSFILGGGVVANERLREKMEKEFGNGLFLCQKEYATDNGAMIATAAHYKYNPVDPLKVEACANLEIGRD